MFWDHRFFWLDLILKKNYLSLTLLSCIETRYAAVKALESSTNPLRKVRLNVYSASGLLCIQELTGNKMVVDSGKMDMLDDDKSNNNNNKSQ
jgi:hypothetical protein